MAEPDRVGSIEIAQDMDFQRRSWKVQRAGWIVMLAAVILGLLGLFGGGPLSSATVGDPAAGLRMSYERFTRLASPETLDFEIGAGLSRRDSVAAVWLDRKWIESGELGNITPAPEATILFPDRIEYRFRAGSTGGAPLRVRMHIETRALGRRTGKVGIPGGPSWEFSQLALP